MRAVLIGVGGVVFLGALTGIYMFWRFGLPEKQEIAAAHVPKPEPKPPARPPLVPISAVWAGGWDGGNFFECSVDEKHDVDRCLVYNDSSGDVEGGGFFQLKQSHRAAQTGELKFEFFDGEKIELAGGSWLAPVQAVRPEPIPSNATFANGLFISCEDLRSGTAHCSIYRPDGALYFEGRFSLEAGPSAERGHWRYKFFSLSDRTISLEGGGSMVSK